MSKQERYGTCSDEDGNWGIEDDGKVILSGLVSHDACDAVMDILDERDALKEDAERYRLASLQGDVARIENARLKAEVERLTEAGDHMAAVIIEYRCSPWGRKVPNAFTVWQAWFDAKEGKPRA